MTFKTSSKRCAEIDAASKAEEHLLEGITHPGLHDCLCGRGGHATNHPGNVQFRMLVSKYKDYYMGLSRYGKLQVAAEVVKLWRSQTPAGRFLAMTDPSNRENTTWHDIGDKEAIKKTSQCLRERIPPHQKARTLDMVTKKVKTIENPRNRTNSVASQEHDSNPRMTQQLSMQQLCEPRPMMEPALVSNTATPISPGIKREVSMSNSSLPAFEKMQGARRASASPVPLPVIKNSSNNENSSRMSAWENTGGMVVPSMSSEDLNWMAEALDDDNDNETLSNKSRSDAKYNDDRNNANVDGSQIPSAANLTMDVFDDSVYKPLMQSTTKTFGGQDWNGVFDSYSASPATTLNETLSSNMQSMFSSMM